MLDASKGAKRTMRWRQLVVAVFLFVVCLAYYVMAYGQAVNGSVTAAAVVNVDELMVTAGDNASSSAAESPYVMDKPSLCADGGALTLLVMVVTAPNNTEARLAIRRTWGTVAQRQDVRLAFVLGLSLDNDTQPRLLEEDAAYGDLVQGRFIDGYLNLTRKSVFILKWADTRCPNARYVLKIDDDCFLNSAALLTFLSGRKETTAIFGRVWSKVKPIRDVKHKWSVSKEAFAGSEFPTYTGGPSYVLTAGEAVRRLLQVVSEGGVGWLSLEDVFITGLCADKAKVARVNENKFNMDDTQDVCQLANVITYHRVTPDCMYFLWWAVNDRKLTPHCQAKGKHKPLVEMANLVAANLHY